jgi:hypothetical protein
MLHVGMLFPRGVVGCKRALRLSEAALGCMAFGSYEAAAALKCVTIRCLHWHWEHSELAGDAQGNCEVAGNAGDAKATM